MSARSRRTLAASAALGLGGAALALTMGPADAAPVTETFEFTGAAEAFPVPEGICSVTVDAFGAAGGVAVNGVEGGLGGRATATIEVTPGESLVVRVGGQGGDAVEGTDDSPAEGTPGLGGEGGFNGGASAADGLGTGGGGGGGASDVRQGGDALANRVVVAGGGGGSGGDGAGKGADTGGGGDGGGTSGTDGANSDFGSDGGDGGTQSAGGAGGTTDPTAGDGTDGAGGVGGAGNNNDEGGGGGGGGWFGGGGGSGDINFVQPPAGPQDEATGDAEGLSNEDGGGGGGGSGFGPAGVAFETGVQDGDGTLTITYDPETDSCDPDVEPDDTVPPVVQAEPAFTG